MKTSILILIALNFAITGCGQMESGNGANNSLGFHSPYEEEAPHDYKTLSLEVESAAQGSGSPKGLGDLETLTDDQIIALVIQRMRDGLASLKARAEESGDSRFDLEKLEAAIEKIIQRLNTDAAFAEKFVDGLRNRPKPNGQIQDGGTLPDAACKRLRESLASGKVPDGLKDRIEQTIEKRCSK